MKKSTYILAIIVTVLITALSLSSLSVLAVELPSVPFSSEATNESSSANAVATEKSTVKVTEKESFKATVNATEKATEKATVAQQNTSDSNTLPFVEIKEDKDVVVTVEETKEVKQALVENGSASQESVLTDGADIKENGSETKALSESKKETSDKDKHFGVTGVVIICIVVAVLLIVGVILYVKKK
jgi:hypothetical protein